MRSDLIRWFFLITTITFGSDLIAQEEDCIGSIPICDTSTFQFSTIPEIGLIADLNISNHGCLVGNEHQGVWLHFRIAEDSPPNAHLAFVVQPGVMMDLDFAIWGPFMPSDGSNLENICPPADPPIRCSFAGNTGPTGLAYDDALGTSHGAGGTGFVRHLTTQPAETYLLYIDNFSMNGLQFGLSWSEPSADYGPMAAIDCEIVTQVGASESEVASVHYDPNLQQIQITGTDRNADQWAIYSVNGQQLATGRINNEGSSIMVDDLPRGVFMIQLAGKTKISSTRFIKY